MNRREEIWRLKHCDIVALAQYQENEKYSYQENNRNMGYDGQEQIPPGDGNNKLSETSGNSGSTQTSTETRRDRGCQVHVDNSNKSFE